MNFKPNWITKWAISGMLLGAGFIYSPFWVLAFVGGVYFFYLLSTETKIKKKLLGAWLAWSIKSALVLLWFWSVYPIEWLPISAGGPQQLLIFFYWSLSAICLGTGGVLIAAAVHFFQNKFKILPTFAYIIFIAVIWVLAEIAGSVVFSISAVGDGGGISTSFSFGYVGYLLSEHSLLLPFAKLAGVYSLSFVFIIITLVTYYIFSQPNKNNRIFIGLLFIVFYLTSFVDHVDRNIETKAGFQVVTIDTHYDYYSRTNEGFAVKNSLDKAMTSALALESDYIILPEDTRYFNQTRPSGAVKSLFQLQHDKPSTIIIDSGRVQQDNISHLQAFIYDGLDNEIYKVQKRYLVPQGEYMPYVHTSVLRLLGQGPMVSAIEQKLSYTTGTETNQKNLGDAVPAVLFCFESVSPTGVHTLLKERESVPFVAHIQSHAWFHEPQMLWGQLDAMLKVQAVWNNQYIISAGNMVSGKVYTPTGNVVHPETIEYGEGWMLRQVTIPKSN